MATNQRVKRGDVAAKAGVSKTTVSYVLNGRRDAGIPDGTWDRVLEAARELGYTPNRAATALRTGQTGLVGLWMSVLGLPYYGEIVAQVEEILRGAGYEMMVSDTASHTDWEAHVARLAEWPVDGILAFDSGRYVRYFRERYGHLGTPVACMGVDVDSETDSVFMDLAPGAKAAIDHLADSGCKRFAYLGDRYAIDQPDPRNLEYFRAIRERGLQPETIVVPERRRRSAFEATRAYIAAHGAPEAIFAYNDDLAIGAHRAILDLGLQMPEDVRLVGHDGTEDTQYMAPRLSTVNLPRRQMVRAAWDLLANRIRRPDTAVARLRLNSSLIVRRSSSPDIAPNTVFEDESDEQAPA